MTTTYQPGQSVNYFGSVPECHGESEFLGMVSATRCRIRATCVEMFPGGHTWTYPVVLTVRLRSIEPYVELEGPALTEAELLAALTATT